jgi:hypothetical protein
MIAALGDLMARACVAPGHLGLAADPSAVLTRSALR